VNADGVAASVVNDSNGKTSSRSNPVAATAALGTGGLGAPRCNQSTSARNSSGSSRNRFRSDA
jgi:hypothetical protein